MASSYDISLGNTSLELQQIEGTYVALQVVSTSSLDADVTVKLQQSSDNSNYEDLADTTQTIAAGENSVYIESYDFTLDTLYLNIDVGSATVGELNIYVSNKKKVESSSTSIPSPLDVNVTNDPLNVAVTSNESDVLNETNIDAFNRLRVSQINSQADLKQIHDELPLFYDFETVGSGSYTNSMSATTLSTSSSGDRVVMQTKQRYNYSSGKSALFLISFKNFITANAIRRVGYYNSSTISPYNTNVDGIFLEANINGICIVVALDGALTRYYTNVWDDPLDGTGASGLDLNLGSNQDNLLLWCDFEWLGVGQIRFGFVSGGQFILAHKIDHIGSNGVYMKSPNHSIRAEVVQSTPSAQSLVLICATFGSEGNVNKLGKILSDNMGNTHVDANSTSNTYALIGLRLATAKVDTLVDLLSFTLLAITNDNQRWEIWLNPTVAGTFTYSAVANSSIETAKGSGSGNTVTTTGATLLASGYINANSADEFNIQSAIRLGMTIAGVQDEIVLCTTPLSSNSDVIASVTWQEIS